MLEEALAVKHSTGPGAADIVRALRLPFLSSIAWAQKDKKEESLPSGMEKIKVGRNVEMVVPVGTKTYKKGDLVILENPGEYVARRLADMEERLQKIEAQEKEFKEKIERLDAMLSQIQENVLEPAEKKGK